MQGGAHSLRWHASLGARKETGTVRLPAAPRKRGSAGAKMYFYTLTTRMVRLGAPGSPSPVCLLTLNHFLSLCFFLNSLCLCTVNSLSPPPPCSPPSRSQQPSGFLPAGRPDAQDPACAHTGQWKCRPGERGGVGSTSVYAAAAAKKNWASVSYNWN